MTVIYTSTPTPAPVAIKKLNNEPTALDADDSDFYDVVKQGMNVLLRRPHETSVNKIIAYSKSSRTWVQ